MIMVYSPAVDLATYLQAVMMYPEVNTEDAEVVLVREGNSHRCIYKDLNNVVFNYDVDDEINKIAKSIHHAFNTCKLDILRLTFPDKNTIKVHLRAGHADLTIAKSDDVGEATLVINSQVLLYIDSLHTAINLDSPAMWESYGAFFNSTLTTNLYAKLAILEELITAEEMTLTNLDLTPNHLTKLSRGSKVHPFMPVNLQAELALINLEGIVREHGKVVYSLKKVADAIEVYKGMKHVGTIKL